MNQVLNRVRIAVFLKYKFTLNYKTWLIQLAAFAGIFTVVSSLLFITITSSDFPSYYDLLLVITLFACGLYITSRSYCELSNTSNGFLFMQLPASVFEKFIVPAVFSGIVFPILFILFFSLVGTVSNAFLSLFYNYDPYVVPLFSDVQIRILKTFITIQPFFLIGAIQFKKQHLLWTTVSFISIAAVFILFWLLISKIAFGSFNHNGNILGFEPRVTLNGFTVSDAIMLLIAMFGWFIAYFKLKEREI